MNQLESSLKEKYFEDEEGLYAEPPEDWDSTIHFDASSNTLKPINGEFVIDTLDNVEDTKGNNGMRGILICTNIRLIWHSVRSMNLNLSIGLNTINNTTVKPTTSKLMGSCQAMHVYAANDKSRFEFIFTHLVPNNPRLFTTVPSVVKAYQSSRLNRELRIRGSFMRGKDVHLLPEEIMDEHITGVWNLSSEQGHLGAFVLTNVRIVWHSMMNDVFNMSLPFQQIVMIRTQNSKYGEALVLETSPQSGKYLLGFRVDPPEKLKPLALKLRQLWKVSRKYPVNGVTVEEMLDDKEEQQSRNKWELRDDIKIVDERVELLSLTDADKKNAEKGQDRIYVQRVPTSEDCQGDLILDPILGLAVERIAEEGKSITDLWNTF